MFLDKFKRPEEGRNYRVSPGGRVWCGNYMGCVRGWSEMEQLPGGDRRRCVEELECRDEPGSETEGQLKVIDVYVGGIAKNKTRNRLAHGLMRATFIRLFVQP